MVGGYLASWVRRYIYPKLGNIRFRHFLKFLNMKFSKLFLATFLVASSVIFPVLAQDSVPSILDLELRRR